MKFSMKRTALLIAMILPMSSFAASVCFTNAPNVKQVQIGKSNPPAIKAMRLTCVQQNIVRSVNEGEHGTFVYDNLPKGTILFLSWLSGNVWETIPVPIVVGDTDAGYTISYDRLNVPMVKKISFANCVSSNVSN